MKTAQRMRGNACVRDTGATSCCSQLTMCGIVCGRAIKYSSPPTTICSYSLYIPNTFIREGGGNIFITLRVRAVLVELCQYVWYIILALICVILFIQERICAENTFIPLPMYVVCTVSRTYTMVYIYRSILVYILVERILYRTRLFGRGGGFIHEAS